MANTATIAYESVASTTYQEGAITITKPTGLAVGDLMVVFLFFASSNTTPTPSGWTVIRNNSTDYTDNTDGAVFYKIADSGDVAASNFSFDVTDGTGSIGGTLIRVSSINSSTVFEQVSVGKDTGTSTTRSHTVSLTPTTSGSMLVAFTHFNINDTMDTYTSTGSPTWTELTQLTGNTSEQLAVVYAPYPSITEVTNFSYTVGSAGAGAKSEAIMFVLRTAVDSDATPTFVASSQSVFAPTGAADANGIAGFVASSQLVFAPIGYADTGLVIENVPKNTEAVSNVSKNAATPSNVAKNTETVSNVAKNTATPSNVAKNNASVSNLPKTVV